MSVKFRIAFVALVSSLVSAVFVAIAPATSAATEWNGCKVSILMPIGDFTDAGAVNAAGRVWTEDDNWCDDRDIQIHVCFEVKYKWNDGTFGAWRNVNKGPFDYKASGCSRYWGPGTVSEMHSYGSASSAQPSNCDDFRQKIVRSAVYFSEGDATSTVRRNTLTKTFIC